MFVRGLYLCIIKRKELVFIKNGIIIFQSILRDGRYSFPLMLIFRSTFAILIEVSTKHEPINCFVWCGKSFLTVRTKKMSLDAKL